MTPRKRWNILLADDGSQHAQSAVELIQSIPVPVKTKINVLRVFGPGQIDLLPGFERSLERTKDQLMNSGLPVKATLLLGSASEKILEVAEQTHPDLIVLGAKGLRSTLGILLGGVAQQVVEYATCPVLIVRAPYRGLRRILLVTDGSPSSHDAARYLGKFPLPDPVEVHVMHVLPPIPRPIMMEPYYGGWQTVYATLAVTDEEKEYERKQTELGDALLARTEGMLRRYGIKPSPVLLRGDAATEILEYVHQNQTDLIVAGSRGLSQFRSLWMGSVSRKLVHYAPCSVLIVKSPRKE